MATQNQNDNATLSTDVERIACTLLHKAHPVHPILRAWRDAISSDPDFAQILSRWRAPADAVQWSLDGGFALPEDLWGTLLDEEAHPRDPQWRAFRGHDNIYAGAIDSAVARLCRAVVTYRAEQRPQGEQVRAIRSGHEPIALVYTSLGAAIVEYHEAIANAYASEAMRREEDADERARRAR